MNDVTSSPILSELKLIREDTLASALGIEVSTLAVWRTRGYGPAYAKLGKQIFYHMSDVAKWVHECRFTPGAAPDEPT